MITIEIARVIKIEPVWALAAMLLSSVEGYVKMWLVNVAKYETNKLEHKQFYDLVKMMEKTLKNKNVKY